jgi:hypothetical protein
MLFIHPENSLLPDGIAPERLDLDIKHRQIQTQTQARSQADRR